MGGSVAAYWAGTRPDRLAALALLEGLGPPDQSERRARRPHRAVDRRVEGRARRSPRPMPSLADAAARLRKHDPLLGEALALRLAEAGTRAGRRRARVEARSAAPDDGPLPVPPRSRRAVLAAHHVPGARRRRRAVDHEPARSPSAPRAAPSFANHRHVTLAGAGHMMQRHQPEALAELLLELVAIELTPARARSPRASARLTARPAPVERHDHAERRALADLGVELDRARRADR